MLLFVAGTAQPVFAALEIGKVALSLAGSADPSARVQLLRILHTPADLAALTKPAGARLRQGSSPSILSQVFLVLASNPAADALPVLVALTRDREFLALAERTPGSAVTELLRATANIAVPPADVIAFWRAHAKPDDGYVNITTAVLAANASASALDLLESLLSDPKFPVENRIAWLWSGVMPHRLNAALISRLGGNADGWPERLRLVLLDILFDPEPHPDASPGSGLAAAPLLTDATPGSAAALRRVAALPWIAHSPPAYREKVRAGLAALSSR